MSSDRSIKPKSLALFGKLFQPNNDFYELLNVQAAKTLEGMKALSIWVDQQDADDHCQAVKDLEAEADEIKLDLAKKLTQSFITPFDREDIYELSLRLDEVINGAKHIAREIEAFETKQNFNPEIKNMSVILVEGTESLVLSFASLHNNHEESRKQALIACKSDNRLAKVYRKSMQELFCLDDIKTILRVKEVYKAMLLCSNRIDSVGERLLHVIMKLA